MKATDKNPAIDACITRTFGVDRKGSVNTMTCGWCGKPADGFRDELSMKEYTISGLCQECQDKTFVEPDEDTCELCGGELGCYGPCLNEECDNNDPFDMRERNERN